MLYIKKSRIEDIQQFMIDSLQFLDRERFTSVGFPALGMGGLSYPPYEVSMAMLTGIARFYNMNQVTTVRTIHVSLFGPDVDSVLMYVQSAYNFIDIFKNNMSEFGACKQPFNVLPSTTLNSLTGRPLARVKSTWQKFLAFFSSSDPVPNGELFRVEVTPLRDIFHDYCKHSFYHAHNSLKLEYLAPSAPSAPLKTSNWVVT